MPDGNIKENIVTNTSFRFAAPYARRVPDPIFHQSHGTERHVLFVPVKSVPKGLPLDPNARVPNLRRRIYRDIQDSLFDQETTPGTFHLKHKGITVIADSVAKDGEGTYTVTLGRNHGIVDGGHTYALIVKNLTNEQLPAKQFVKFEILTGIPNEWIVEIAGGLNTSVQVQPFALDNLAGKFRWIQDTLKKESYYSQIAWKENEDGEYDARDIVSLLTCFNVELFPNTSNGGDSNPVVAYEKKSKALELFEENPESYRRLRPILKDILILHDTVRLESQDLHNEAGGKYGNLSFVEHKERGKFVFPFIADESEYRLMNAALYPILGAFRWMVEIDPKQNKARWRGGFRNVLRIWRSSASELLRITVQKNAEEGRNPNAIGKSRAHWSSLYSRLALRDLQAKVEGAS
ncbi:MAG: AIPR family protein [Bryobacteraceae bacterium]